MPVCVNAEKATHSDLMGKHARVRVHRFFPPYPVISTKKERFFLTFQNKTFLSQLCVIDLHHV